MRAATRPILSAFKGRYYSAQAAAEQAPKGSLAKQEAKISRLKNGAVVATVENNRPVAKLAVLYNAGSRFEDGSQAGITHALRISLNCSNAKKSVFGMTRGIQQMGGNLTATTTREHMMYSLDFNRDDFQSALTFIESASMHPSFPPWQVRDLRPYYEFDLRSVNDEPNVKLIEVLHKAAYRNTLGNSLYMPPHKVGTHSPELLEQFTDKFFVPSNMVLVGTDIGDHDEFIFQLQHRIGFGPDAPKAAPEKVKATYHGGEVRVETSNPLVHAAVVTEGASLGSKDMLALALLQRIMGVGPSIKYSSNLAASKISQAAAGATSGPYAVSAVNINYSDSGLFGFYAVGLGAEMGKILKACMTAYGAATKGAVSDADLARAKTGLKSNIQMSMENGENVLTDLGTQALLTGQYLSAADVSTAIDKVTAADVQSVAKKIINGKPTMAAVGDLTNTPYLDELL